METNNRSNQNYYDQDMYEYTYDLENANLDYDIYSNRFDNRYDRRDDMMYDRRFNRRYDRRFDNRYDNRYYQYPYCDRYGRCENPIWWLFWPFFFF